MVIQKKSQIALVLLSCITLFFSSNIFAANGYGSGIGKGLKAKVADSELSKKGKAAMAKLNINTATSTELAKSLKGIGKKKAEAIVAYRKAHGDFSSVKDLMKVKGISKSILAKNKGLLTLKNKKLKK